MAGRFDPAESVPRAWVDVVTSTSRALAEFSGAEPSAFQPLLDRAVAVGPSPDGSLGVEWVAPAGTPRFGVTLFEHGRRDDHLGLARRLCEAHFDREALVAWDRTLRALSALDVGCHVGLAWEAARGYRLKLFVAGGSDMAGALRVFGAAPHERLIGVGCDFWDGGRYRERSYFQARDVDALRPLAPAWDAVFAPPIALGRGQHVILTRTREDDALGDKVTWSLIFPPEATLASIPEAFAGALHPALPRVSEAAEPYALRPSAIQIDRYRDGRSDHELLLTLGAAAARPG